MAMPFVTTGSSGSGKMALVAESHDREAQARFRTTPAPNTGAQPAIKAARQRINSAPHRREQNHVPMRFPPR